MLIQLLICVPVLLAPAAEDPPQKLPPEFVKPKPSLPPTQSLSKSLTQIIDSKRFINGNGPGLAGRVYRIMKEERNIRLGNLFGGKVLALTEDTITVQNWSEFPRTFSVALPLTSKRIPMEWQCGCGHRLGDVRVGDTVSFSLVPTPRGDVVVALGIYRRPGGIIPPAEDEHLPENCRIHNRWNARQAVEEKILPKLPRMFLHFHP